MPFPAIRGRVRALLAQREAWYRRRRVWMPLAALVLYALAGFLLLPALLRHYLPAMVHDALGVEAGIEELRFNPFLFRLDGRGLALAEANGVPLARVDRLLVDFELSSLFRRAWTFAELRLEGPELDLVREADGRLNLQRVLAPLAVPDADSGAADAPPPRVLVLQAEMPGARIRYSDRTIEPQASAEIGPMDLSIDEIATLEAHRGPYRLQATLPGGARLEWTGQGGLHPLVSDGRLQISGFEPRAVWGFVQPLLRLQPPQGALDLTLDYSASLAGDALALSVDPVEVSLRDLVLQRSGDAQPLLALKAVEVSGGRLDLARRSVSVSEIRLRDGQLGARLDRAGVADWSTLLVAGESRATATPAPEPQAPWQLHLESVGIEGVRAGVYDESRRAPLGFALLARRIGFAASVGLDGAAPRIGITAGQADIADIALSTGADRAPLGRIAGLTVADATVDLGAQRVEAARIALQGIETTIHRESDGSIREVTLASTPDPEVPLPVSSAAAEWQLAVGELALEGIDAGYEDALTTPAIRYGVRGGRILLRELRTGSAEPLAVEATLPLAEGGTLALGGSVNGDGSAADLQLRADGLALQPLAPLVARDTTLELKSGTLSAETRVDYRVGEAGAPVLRATGTLGVDGLLLTEAASGERFLAWRSLAASGVDFGLGPDRLLVNELRLVEPGAKIVVHKDRTTNLAQILREPAADPGDAVPSPGEGAVAPAGDGALRSEAASAAEPFPVLIDRVRVDGGTVDFADNALVLPFAARIERLSGVARGISSASDSRATLKFAGRVGEFGEAEIDGQLAPFDPTRYTDIEVTFRNIAMNQLSPYSATFAGRTIAAGDLELGLEYAVSDGALAGDNKVVLQDFRLGENVESPEAIDLPLDLAIALLTDAEGRIDLAVPVSGNVGDPRFSYGKVVATALGNALRNIVTAPFRALGAAFGGGAGGGEDLQAIRFASGSAELMPRERERLATLAAALAERPQLAIEIAPGIEPERDGYAARRLQVRRAHAAELGLELAPGEDPGPVSYDGAKSQHALEKLLEARDGDDAADRFAAGHAQRSGAEPERVNAALALLGRGAGDAAFYRAMYLHLVNTTPEPAAELGALADARAAAIRTELLARSMDDARLRAGTPRTLTQAKPTGVLLALSLVPAD